MKNEDATESKIISIIDALENAFDEALKQVSINSEGKPNHGAIIHYNAMGSAYADAITEILEAFPHLRDKYPHA